MCEISLSLLRDPILPSYKGKAFYVIEEWIQIFLFYKLSSVIAHFARFVQFVFGSKGSAHGVAPTIDPRESHAGL